MAQPGWFPDPGGQPGMFRYWDGTAWTQELSAGPPGRGPSRPVKPGRGSGPIVAGFAALVVLVLLAIVVLPRMFGDGSNPTETRAAPRSPTVSAWDETTRPTPTPTPTPTKSPEVSLPCPKYDEAVVNGRLYGGGLSVPMINDSRWSVNPVRSIPWAVCATGLERRIAADWVS